MRIFEAEDLARMNNKLSRFLNRVINNCQISKEVYIPESLKMPHHGYGVIIGKGAKFGSNVIIYPNTIIGHKNPDTTDGQNLKYPTIGNNVIIYSYSIVIGQIAIGDNVVIGAGSFIDKDVPSNSIVYNQRKMIVRKR